MMIPAAPKFLVPLSLCVALLAAAWPLPAVLATGASPFERVAGRWVGEGRLGMKEGGTEIVKCRATYFVEEGGRQVRQNVRCASSGGSIEIASTVSHAAGVLNGTWKELSRNMGGELAGSVTPNGFRVAVTGSDLSAHMDIIVKDARQIVEIQFNNSALVGLTLILNKSDGAVSSRASSAAPSR